MHAPDPAAFARALARARAQHPDATIALPLVRRLLADQLTPVLAYRRLVAPDQRTAPSFLFESVEAGRQGRYSFLGAQPALQCAVKGHDCTVTDHRTGSSTTGSEPDPLLLLRSLSRRVVQALPDDLPHPPPFLGGWVGYAGYDTVRFAEPDKLNAPPPDDRDLLDIHMARYDDVVVFDHVEKLVYVIAQALVAPGDDPDAAFNDAAQRLDQRTGQIQRHARPLASGTLLPPRPAQPLPSNITKDQHRDMVLRAKEFIRAGDIFQVVVGQRFHRTSTADPFDVYRTLRAVNPSPYMVYLQAPRCILVASSPEILCRVRRRHDHLVLTNRPLAGTRPRGATPDHDARLADELLADPKERAEHAMLVDLGRNDVGRVCTPGTVRIERLMDIERYSHVMHISSTITGRLRPGLDAWDALRATLPVGTISGAPKIRAMQIIDLLEPVRRGPYGGGIGYVGFDGQMDIALALRTIVVPTALHHAGHWTYHLQAAGGIVADSDPDAEYLETVNKAAALARAIDAAEDAFP